MKVFRKILSGLLVFLIFCASFALMGSISLQRSITPENIRTALTPEVLAQIAEDTNFSDVEERMDLPSGFFSNLMQTEQFSEVLSTYLSDLFQGMLTGERTESMTSEEAVDRIQEAFSDTEQEMQIQISDLEKSIFSATFVGYLQSALSNAATSQFPLTDSFWFSVEIARAMLLGPVQLLLLFVILALTVLLCLCQGNWYRWTLLDGAAFLSSGALFLIASQILLAAITQAFSSGLSSAALPGILSSAAGQASIAGIVTLCVGFLLVMIYLWIRRQRKKKAMESQSFSA